MGRVPTKAELAATWAALQVFLRQQKDLAAEERERAEDENLVRAEGYWDGYGDAIASVLQWTGAEEA